MRITKALAALVLVLVSITGHLSAFISETPRQGFDAVLSITPQGVEVLKPGTDARFTLTSDSMQRQGILFNRNRYYSPKTGRFTSRDPIGFNGGNNLWGYCGNNPVRYTDPSGKIFAAYFLLRMYRNFEGTLDEMLVSELLQARATIETALQRVSMQITQIEGQDPCDPRLENLRKLQNDLRAALEEFNKDPNKTRVSTGLGQAPKKGPPNSIYEQLDRFGNVISRTFYDENGNSFSRQDFEHSHGGMQPHQHDRPGFDEFGRPNSPETTQPLPPGYNDQPTRE